MRCILHGHNFQPFAGSGAYAGQTFMVCVECGKTRPMTAEEKKPGGINYVTVDWLAHKPPYDPKGIFG